MTQVSFAGMEAIFFTGGDPLHRRSGHVLGSSGNSESGQATPFNRGASGLALIAASGREEMPRRREVGEEQSESEYNT